MHGTGASKVGILCSVVRLEEKRIFQAFRECGVAVERIDVRKMTFELNGAGLREYDVVLLRCVSHSQALYGARILQMRGIHTVNPYRAVATCGDKVLTTLALLEHGVPTPRTIVALSRDSALEALDRIGYPAVLKPPVGSWGRLMAKVGDRLAAEAVLEHKQALGRWHDTAFYIQDYVDKPGRDIRTMVIGDETVYAIYRHSAHWITNTARGGGVSSLPVTPEVDRLSRAAAAAVGGGIVAVDILESPDGSLLVNEVNHTPEFHGAMEAVGVDIAAKMADYVMRYVYPGQRPRQGSLAVGSEEDPSVGPRV